MVVFATVIVVSQELSLHGPWAFAVKEEWCHCCKVADKLTSELEVMVSLIYGCASIVVIYNDRIRKFVDGRETWWFACWAGHVRAYLVV